MEAINPSTAITEFGSISLCIPGDANDFRLIAAINLDELRDSLGFIVANDLAQHLILQLTKADRRIVVMHRKDLEDTFSPDDAVS